MTDRELLELAAKAAGYDETRTCIDEWFWVNTSGDEWEPWNPLTDDGDALRLAVKLRLVLLLELPRIGIGPHMDWPDVYVDEGEDEFEAARRAIVHAAAAIGRDMK